MNTAKPLIVGIGASAGGIHALKSFFSEIPNNPVMAFVVVTHLSPTRESLLHEVISRFTKLPVSVIRHGDPVKVGTVHVLPENAILSIKEGHLQLIALDPLHREHRPIDVFFSALAADQGDRAVGIVMSGGDGDGTLGVKAIKQNGGFSFAQKVEGDDGPEVPSMPESAISSGWVDFELPADRMPAKLAELQSGEPELSTFLERAEVGDLDDEQHFQNQIAQLLRNHSRHDFKGYKSKTFFRRVARRMQVTHTTTPEDYLELLRQNPDEVMALFRDLLISVTDFFRDPDAFHALATQVIPKLLDGRGADDVVRIWVPGCASGEEVYSLAILLREQMEGQVPCPQVQIFATDIDEPALIAARAARYPAELLKDLSEDRRSRFFRKSGASYLVAREVRDMCIFSPQSIISDPPFSRMDLVSCRNLLIYLGAELQQQVIPTMHYALKSGGYLFLGRSESISQHDDLFMPIDKAQRIFQSRDVERRPPPSISLRKAKPAYQRFEPGETPSSRAHSYQLRRRVLDQLIDRHIPAHVVIRAEGDIVYYSARTRQYFDTPEGAPNRQLLETVDQGLRPYLRSALREAQETANSSTRHAVMIGDETGQATDLTVEPLGGGEPDDKGTGDALFLVLFQPLAVATELQRDDIRPESEPADVTVLEREVRDMRARMRSMVEEYETAMEELKSTNEELISVNQESQSTNEELQSSKEEMQSLNEELSTVNAELNEKVEELDSANVDLKNLYKSTGIATVFLDKDLMIRNFTPAASMFFKLRASDIGRPLTDLTSSINYSAIEEDIRTVFESGESVEHKLCPDGHEDHYLVRTTPYFDEDQITGVVMTFVEITSLAKAEEHQNLLIAELNHRVKNMLAVVLSVTQATKRSATSIDGFAEALTARLHSMAKAYELVASQSWSEVPLHDLLNQEIAAFGPGRVTMQGAEILLPPEKALAVGMIIHELLTNAAKHGALSVPDGRISINWSAPEDSLLNFHWKEEDGPPVKAPPRRGFGLNLVLGQIEAQLGGSGNLSFLPEGFELYLTCPLRA